MFGWVRKKLAGWALRRARKAAKRACSLLPGTTRTKCEDGARGALDAIAKALSKL